MALKELSRIRDIHEDHRWARLLAANPPLLLTLQLEAGAPITVDHLDQAVNDELLGVILVQVLAEAGAPVRGRHRRWARKQGIELP